MTGEALTLSWGLYALIPFAFLMGSIPFGVIFTRGKGVDIRSVGSRNIGATNVLRYAGKTTAILTLLGDILKGFIPMLLCSMVLGGLAGKGLSDEAAVFAADLWLGAVALSAVAGHMFSLFLAFRGGKGVATGFGVLLVYSPISAGLILLIWLVTAFAFKYSALAALVAVGALPFIFYFFNYSMIKLVSGTVLALLIVFKHRSNIQNLLSGKEDKIGGKAH